MFDVEVVRVSGTSTTDCRISRLTVSFKCNIDQLLSVVGLAIMGILDKVLGSVFLVVPVVEN
jgi:hypothetical protein